MKIFVPTFVFACLMTVVPLAEGQTPDRSQDEQAIRNITAAYGRAFNQGDAKALAAKGFTAEPLSRLPPWRRTCALWASRMRRPMRDSAAFCSSLAVELLPVRGTVVAVPMEATLAPTLARMRQETAQETTRDDARGRKNEQQEHSQVLGEHGRPFGRIWYPI